MKEIPLTRGKVALVDDEDFEQLFQFQWYADLIRGRWYVMRIAGLRGRKRRIYMHRDILGIPLGVEVDHKDGNGLNNQRYNLRPATHAQNLQNRGKPSSNTSGYKGVSWFKRDGKWRACIGVDGRVIHLGYYDTAEEAARAYNEAAPKYHGKFAKLNEI